MAAHILTVIRQAKEQKVTDAERCLEMYKHGAGYAAWGRLLDLRDYEAIDRCTTWDELVLVMDAMDKKYELMWEIAGHPVDWEEWNKHLNKDSAEFVDSTYWQVYNMEVNYAQLTA